MAADLILHHAVVRTMDAAGTVADALAIEADRIVAVGSASELAARFVGPATELLNVGGRMVLPGFIDAHVHFELTALSLAQSVDCRTVGSISELIERLRERAARTPAGQWVVGQGVFFQDTRIVEGRYPDRHDLDKVSTEHPVLVRFSFHVAVLNSHALALCRVSRDTPDPQGGEVQRDEAGEPTGMTRDMVHHLGLPPPRVEEVRTALATVGRQRLLANGVTTIQEISGSRQGVAALADLVRGGELPLRVALSVHVPGTLQFEDALQRRLDQIRFDGTWFVDGGIKLFADGGTTAHAAALHEPYADEPSTRGRLAFSAEEFWEILDACDRAGRRVCVHAVGDRAQDTVLDGFDRLARRRRTELRHRVEHAGNLLATDERLTRYRQLGLIAAPNATFIYTFGDALEAYLGPERARRPFRFRTLLDMGFTVPGNSDCTGPEPLGLSPLFNIWCAVTRRTYRDRLLVPEEAISTQQGLELFTWHAAYGLGQERIKGTLEAGKLADLVVLAEDPLAVAADHIKDVAVDFTFVGGRLVHHRPDAQPLMDNPVA